MKIYFVDELPPEKVLSLNLAANKKCTGLCCYKGYEGRTETLIYVMNRPKKALVLLHELLHWAAFYFGHSQKAHSIGSLARREYSRPAQILCLVP